MAIDNRKKNFNIHGVISSQNKIQPPIMIIGNYKKMSASTMMLSTIKTKFRSR